MKFKKKKHTVAFAAEMKAMINKRRIVCFILFSLLLPTQLFGTNNKKEKRGKVKKKNKASLCYKN